nr:hypothetical protein Iba_chr11fCG10590 [Ipomoea batatas]
MTFFICFLLPPTTVLLYGGTGGTAAVRYHRRPKGEAELEGTPEKKLRLQVVFIEKRSSLPVVIHVSLSHYHRHTAITEIAVCWRRSSSHRLSYHRRGGGSRWLSAAI